MITQAECRSFLSYDESTGIFTRIRSMHGLLVGKPTGVLAPNGYLRIRLCGRWYPAHRLAWFYVTGEWPPEDIDHKDGHRANNRFANLRLASRSENLGNMRVKAHSCAYKGVSFYKRTGRWRARIRKDGKLIDLGYHGTPEQAHAAYVSAAAIHFGEFARAA